MFDFDSADPNLQQGKASAPLQGCSKRLMQRALLRWLLTQEAPPAGMALDVPTRVVRFKADVGAFWNISKANPHDEGPSKVLQPTAATLIQCYTEREECWTDCTRTDEIMPRLEELREQRSELEAVIRNTEPALRDPHTLFEEYAEWHYENSQNKTYHAVHRQIERLEHALLEGTKFEQIRGAGVADFLYLAVPENLVTADELADGWGLLWVAPNLHVTIKRSAMQRDCFHANRMHLVQNIATSATKSVLFANGLRTSQSGDAYFVQQPRGHRKRKRFRLS